MAYENGWKDGWSSADHATESYSPYAWERAQRDAIDEREQRQQATQSEDNRRKWQERLEAEQAKTEFRKKQDEINLQWSVEQRKTAIRYIVQQKREEYNKKSWFGKAMSKIKGTDFNKIKRQIEIDAIKRVEKMTDEQVESFNERHEMHEGKTR